MSCMVYAAIVFPPPLNIAMSNFHHRRTLLPPPKSAVFAAVPSVLDRTFDL